MSLGCIGSLKHQNICCAPAYRRIQCIQPVCAHQHNSGEAAIRKSINAANESINACTVFVMHLIGLARLCKRIGLVNQKDDTAARAARDELELLASLNACSNAAETSWVISPTRPCPREERLSGSNVMSMPSWRATLSPIVSANSVLPGTDIAGKNH
jgi:hypothetical protein